ncbi:tetratricopeptide repeat protein [Kordia sp. YSTF-M3]|uniref:Tetratricopeptide repeat protein n=1 Tax=Kordia aestuariivivens TaxID=2759037 RepID=A0ABR7QBM6_9FLAO|nr:tetratricopeptide repeat protein [Kordia aestuariivivens]MBC8755981.1 tetratricopeptide repeat protein [Kordia aestuariivivens]
MRYSDLEIGKAQRDVFISFMQEIVRTHAKRKKVTDYTEDDIKDLHKELNKFLKDNKVPEIDRPKTVGFTTLKGYVDICKDENKILKYREYVLNLCSKYIDNFPKYKDFRNYIARRKDSLGFSKYEIRELTYPYKPPINESKQFISASSSSYEELSLELRSKLNENEISIHIQYHSNEIKKNPNDDIHHYWLGVLLLQIKQYDAAINHLNKSIEINSTNEEYYYNLALAKFKGKRPSRLKMDEIMDILQSLNTAIRMNNKKAKFYRLKQIINKDYFEKKGLKVPAKVIELKAIKRLDQDPFELKRLMVLLNLPYKKFTDSKY